MCMFSPFIIPDIAYRFLRGILTRKHFVSGNPSKFVRPIKLFVKGKAMLCPVYRRHIFVINHGCIILHKPVY